MTLNMFLNFFTRRVFKVLIKPSKCRFWLNGGCMESGQLTLLLNISVYLSYQISDNPPKRRTLLGFLATYVHVKTFKRLLCEYLNY